MPEAKNFGPKKSTKGGMPINIIGQGFSEFQSGSVLIKFGSAQGNNTQVKNDQHVKTELPAGLPDSAYALVLQATLAGGQAFSQALETPFQAGPEPDDLTISDVYPDMLASAGGETVNIYGFHFQASGRTAAPKVHFNYAVVVGSVVNDSLIQVISPSFADTRLSSRNPIFQVKVEFSATDTVTAPEATRYSI